MKLKNKYNEELSLVAQSSSANRVYFISYIAFLVYLLIIVASTTDYQLLIPKSQIRLPFVDTNVTLLLFYLVAPIMILAGHFNLLQNLDSHHHKLNKWSKSFYNQQVPRNLIQPFLYDFFVLEKDSKFYRYIRVFSSIVFIYLAPISLIAFLVRFGNYQSIWITSFHFIILCLDYFFISIFLKSIEHKFSHIGIFLFLMGIVQACFVAYIIFADTSNIWKFADARMNWDDGAYTDCCYDLLADGSENPDKARPLWRYLLPRIVVTLTDKTLQDSIDFTNRTLKGAQLIGFDLKASSFKGANLEGADLSSSNLEGADFSLSCLRGATFENANLKSTFFDNSDLSKANFHLSKLDDAYFGNAVLLNTYFNGQNVKGSQLNGAISDRNNYIKLKSNTLRTVCSNFLPFSKIYLDTAYLY